MLTGKEIAERGVIKGYLPENIQQQGIDVRVSGISRVSVDKPGHIPSGNTRKTIIPKVIPLSCFPNGSGGEFGWNLEPGYYEVTFDEGCEIPDDCCMWFKSRSSLVRCGGDVRSGLFDAGFKTNNMGAFLKMELPIFIEKHARIAQAIVDSSNKVENTYNGQWQGDNQRKDS